MKPPHTQMFYPNFVKINFVQLAFKEFKRYTLEWELRLNRERPTPVEERAKEQCSAHALSTTESPVHKTNAHNTNAYNTNAHNTNAHNTNVHNTNAHNTTLPSPHKGHLSASAAASPLCQLTKKSHCVRVSQAHCVTPTPTDH